MPSLSLIKPRPDLSGVKVLSRLSGDLRALQNSLIVASDTPGAVSIDLPHDCHASPVEPVHDPRGRNVVYCAGPSGCGKSTFARGFARRYRELYPRRTICLISRLDDDDTLATGGELDLRRIKIASLVERPATITEFRETLCIVDDVEGFGKAEAAAVQNLSEMIANLGRHEAVSLLYLSHQLTRGLQSRNLLSEAQVYVVFPGAASHNMLRHLLTYYVGIDSSEVSKIKKLPSRWVAIHRTYPRCCIFDGGGFLLNSD